MANRSALHREHSGSPPSVLKIEEETFGQPFRRGQEIRAEQTVNRFGREPNIRENDAKASEARHEKVEQHRQDAIAKRQAEQATSCSDSPAVTKQSRGDQEIVAVRSKSARTAGFDIGIRHPPRSGLRETL